MKKVTVDDVEQQIYSKRREVRYDIRDFSVEYISNKYDEGIAYSIVDDNERKNVIKRRNVIFIPEYQRDFTWDEKRQSKLIESILLGLPIPFIFVAENSDGAWEIVDGSQRIRTIHAFVNNKLKLAGLDSLDTANNFLFQDFDESRQGKFLDSALRIIVLSEETTEDNKRDMFERINRGSDLLKPMEKRKGIYTGPFTEFIYEYADNNDKFKNLVKLDKWLEKRQERSELLLRFFALSDDNNYSKGISGGIATFLDNYLERKNNQLKGKDDKFIRDYIESETRKIDKVVEFVEKYFPYGFRHLKNPQTKRSVFEAISVGTYLAISNGKLSSIPSKEKIEELINSSEFKKFTHVANELHKKEKLKSRVEFIENMLKGQC
ncbi:DUF262 domain-containing protein [Klebsiella pneumoniae]|uniref:DUF262 domain-containing protein n=1 Tax=Klebsiella pneumoniae complex TaxID=3390273 RepID=UPI001CBCFEEC|nr:MULTISPECIES: DUF262 domain-containing protein [Klebsiella]MBZ1877610.1 DUF262 domain-containing protein [Klebsiella pneumoniae]HBS1998653.1 DUF262 domain-containing protein [Klebsiella quasipneumoniae subsp. quasipneumoniae]